MLLRRPRAQERPLEVRVDDRVPVLVGHLEEQVVARDAGAGDQDVEPAVAPSRSARPSPRPGSRSVTSHAMARPPIGPATSVAGPIVQVGHRHPARLRAANSCAVAAPMPRPPPVTSATLSVEPHTRLRVERRAAVLARVGRPVQETVRLSPRSPEAGRSTSRSSACAGSPCSRASRGLLAHVDRNPRPPPGPRRPGSRSRGALTASTGDMRWSSTLTSTCRIAGDDLGAARARPRTRASRPLSNTMVGVIIVTRVLPGRTELGVPRSRVEAVHVVVVAKPEAGSDHAARGAERVRQRDRVAGVVDHAHVCRVRAIVRAGRRPPPPHGLWRRTACRQARRWECRRTADRPGAARGRPSPTPSPPPAARAASVLGQP